MVSGEAAVSLGDFCGGSVDLGLPLQPAPSSLDCTHTATPLGTAPRADLDCRCSCPQPLPGGGKGVETEETPSQMAASGAGGSRERSDG